MVSINETTDWDASSSGASLGYLTPGHTISGALSSAADVDWVRVPMAAQQSYTLSVSGDVSVYLTDLGSTWNFSGSGLSYTATHPSSEYFLVVSGAAAASYTLSVNGVAADGLADEAGATPASAGTLTVGGSVGGIINGNDTTTDTDWFAVSLTANESYTWTMTPTNSVVGATGGGFLKLFDSSGTEIGTTWSASAWNDGASLTFTPAASGTYYVEAAAYPGFTNAGSYVLDMAAAKGGASPTLSLSGATVTEGNDGTATVALTLSLSTAAASPVTVSYRTVDGTAVASRDYAAVPGDSVTFAPGETSKALTFSVIGDTTAEDNEDFYVQLTGATEAKLSAVSGIFAKVTVANDDSGSTGGVTILGTDLPEIISTQGGDDVVIASKGNDTIDGGDGTDRVSYDGSQNSYTVTLGPSGVQVRDRRPDGNGTDTLTNIEFLEYTGDFANFNLEQFGGATSLNEADFKGFIELYIAYFNRAPDAIGLNFWGTAYANGTTMEEMAALFAPQDETLATYPDGTSNTEFATAVYNNVLGRTPDQAGFEFWVGVLERGGVTRDQFILEVLRGVQDGSPDRDYLDIKVDVGAYFAVHKGMSDTSNASAAMLLYDGTDESIQTVKQAIDAYHFEALDPINGEFLMPLVGVLDNPFI